MKYLIGFVVVLGLVGCGDGYNQAKIRQAMIDEFKTTDVVGITDSRYRFVVRAQDGSVWYAEAMGAKAEVTAKTMLFAPK